MSESGQQKNGPHQVWTLSSIKTPIEPVAWLATGQANRERISASVC